MESFKNKLEAFINSEENFPIEKASKFRKILAFFMAAGFFVVSGFVLSLVWNTLSIFIGLETWTTFEAMRDLAAIVGLFLLWQLICELKQKNND